MKSLFINQQQKLQQYKKKIIFTADHDVQASLQNSGFSQAYDNLRRDMQYSQQEQLASIAINNNNQVIE